jgi:bacterioferritin (cytochrome b1)
MPSVVVIDVLNSLLEAELNSIFRYMDESSPYLGRATAEVRRPLQEMVNANQRHTTELALMIERLGGTPLPRSISPEEQYLAFLSLKFLLPKLVEAKKLCIQRYDNAMKAIPDAPAEVKAMLRAHQADHRAHLAILEKAATDVQQAPHEPR